MAEDMTRLSGVFCCLVSKRMKTRERGVREIREILYVFSRKSFKEEGEGDQQYHATKTARSSRITMWPLGLPIRKSLVIFERVISRV